MALCSLETALAYRHPQLLLRYHRETGIGGAEAESIFLELKRWLWLRAHALEEVATGERDEPVEFLVMPVMRVLDELWHVFLLYSEDYERYCRDTLGHFIHHRPQRIHLDETPAEREARRLRDKAVFRRQVEHTIDVLGEDVAVLWYQTLAERYPSARFDRRPTG